VCSFLKKRAKKPLLVGLRVSMGKFASGEKGEGGKVFCFFFSKNKAVFFANPTGVWLSRADASLPGF
jgi:hypothetical protein